MDRMGGRFLGWVRNIYVQAIRGIKTSDVLIKWKNHEVLQNILKLHSISEELGGDQNGLYTFSYIP